MLAHSTVSNSAPVPHISLRTLGKICVRKLGDVPYATLRLCFVSVKKCFVGFRPVFATFVRIWTLPLDSGLFRPIYRLSTFPPN